MTSDKNNTPEAGGGIVKNASVTLLGAVVGGALSFGNEVASARFLGVENYGLYALGLLIARVGEVLSMFGLRLSVLHFLPLHRKDGRADLLAGTIIAALALPMVVGPLFLLGVWFGAPALEQLVFKQTGALPYIQLLALAIPFMSLSDILGHMTRAFGHAGYYVLTRNLVPPVVFMLLLTYSIFTKAQELSITRSFLIAHIMGFVVGIVSVVKVVGPTLWRVRPRFECRTLYSYSFPILLNTLLYMVIAWTGIFMIGAYMTPEDIGIYRACMQLMVVFEIIAVAFNAATSHIYSVLAREKRVTELDSAYGASIRWASLLTLSSFAVIALNVSDLLGVMGPAFRAGAPALLILSLGHLIVSTYASAGFLLVISGRQVLETRNALVAAVLNIVLNVMLIPHFGIVGAATATTCSLLVFACLRVSQVRNIFQVVSLRPAMVRTASLLLGAILGLSVASALTGYSTNDNVAALLGKITLVSIIVTAVLWRFDLNGEERLLLRRGLQTAWAKVGR